MLELREMLAGSTGLEPAASGVTGRRSNQLNYHPKRGLQSTVCCLQWLRSVTEDRRLKTVDRLVGGAGFEPATAGV